MSSPEDVDWKKFLADVDAGVTAATEARASRRAYLDSMQPVPRKCLVVWIDLLGFKHQLLAAKTPEQFLTAYRRVREVQEEFEKPSATTEPDQEETNMSLGKRVVAISDGLLIALDLEPGEWSQISTNAARAASFLDDVRLAQARLASTSNFVRGAMALGNFWFQDDILLSPALVEAYENESTKAIQPVVIMERNLAEALRAASHPDDKALLKDYFRDCEWMGDEDREKFVMLDFMPAFGYDDNPVRWLEHYSKVLRKAHDTASDDHVRNKYAWLCKYAREYAESEFPQFDSECFCLPPTGTLEERNV